MSARRFSCRPLKTNGGWLMAGRLVLIGAVVALCLSIIGRAEARQPISDRVVLANPGDHAATFKIGHNQRNVAPKRAAVLRPKQFPVAIEYWSGNDAVGWKSLSVAEPGLYAFGLKAGQWTLVRRGTPKATSARPAPTAAPRRVAQTRRAIRNTTPVRVGGGRLGRPGQNLYAVAHAAMQTYRFIQDEHDRYLFRRLVHDIYHGKWDEVHHYLEQHAKDLDPALFASRAVNT